MITQGKSIELELPSDLHHAVFVHAHPGAGPGRHEHVDAKGSAELIQRIAEIASLAELGKLTDAVSDAGATVHVTSPTPRIVISVGPDGTD